MSADLPKDQSWQTETWFPKVPCQKLQNSLIAIKQVLPLPLEQVQMPDQAGLAALAERIESIDKSKATIALAHTLTSRELDLVFPLLAALAKTKAPDREAVRQAEILHERLLLIIRERACPSLYQSGWLAFQACCPCPDIAHALSLLCRILEIKQQSRPQNSFTPIDVFKQEPLMISQVVLPDARQFMPRLLRERVDRGLSLEQLMQRYDIRRNLPLGISLAVRYFLTDDLNEFEGNHKMFGLTIRQASQDQQAELLHHFFGLKKLPDQIRNRYCQQIYRVFDDPASDHPIWIHVKPKDRQAFQDWVLAANIGTHCRHMPEKARLYLTYSDLINRIEHWNDDTLLIYFPDFVIADSRLQPELAICYSRAGVGNPFELATGEFNPNPADSAIPHRPIEQVIRSGDFSGVIGLAFDREGIRLTSVLLDMRLRSRRGNSRRRLRLFGN